MRGRSDKHTKETEPTGRGGDPDVVPGRVCGRGGLREGLDEELTGVGQRYRRRTLQEGKELTVPLRINRVIDPGLRERRLRVPMYHELSGEVVETSEERV